jgi:hypothetical protein
MVVLLFVVGGCQDATELDNSAGEEASVAPDKMSSTDMPTAPPNANEWLVASNILRRAGELVEERGFQQGALEEVPQECVATALEHAFEEGSYSIVDFNYAREAISQVLGVSREPDHEAGDPLAVPYWGRLLMEWNDAPGRTEAEVIEAFQEAARKALALREEAIELGG